MPLRNLSFDNSAWIILAVFWSILSFLHGWQETTIFKNSTLKLAEAEARASYNKDLAYRRWAAEHQGFYVEVTQTTPPNPYLRHLTERDIITPEGRQLTLINPASMTRQVHDLSQQQPGVRGHITSLNPLRPENQPDQWERASLHAFEQGRSETRSVETIDGQRYLRMMFPMRTEANCLSCHALQGYRVGDIRGGISVSVPLGTYQSALRTTLETSLFNNSMMWLLGLGLILMFQQSIRNKFNDVEFARRQTEESERKYRMLFEEAIDGFCLTDLENGLILDCNNVLAHMVGRHRNDLIGRHQRILYPEEGTDSGLPYAYEQQRNASEGSQFGARLKTKHGELVEVEVKTNRVELDGRVVLHGIFHDQTEQKRLQAQAYQASQRAALGELAAGVAHEVNNPINGIINYAQLLLNHSGNESMRTEIPKRIIKEGDRISAIVRSLLSLARDTGTEMEHHRLSSINTTVLSLVRTQLNRDGITVNLEIGPELPELYCNRQQLEQLAINLINNARYALNERFPEPHPDKLLTISLKLRQQDGAAWVDWTFTDQGTGIPADLLHRVLNPFVTTKSAGVGTGLGLSLCHDIVKRHQGQIQIDSIQQQFTRVSISLPIIEPAS